MLGRFGRSTESKFLRLEYQSVPQSGFAAGDEKRSAGDVVEAVENKEAVLGVTMRFEYAVSTNVCGRDVSFDECRADHEEAMALQGILFSTHEGNDAGPRERKGALEAGGKIRSAAPRRVINKAVLAIDSRISGSAA